ncbi:Phage terminase, small subunit [Mycobacterium bohemicum DSM 44277]|uniref:Phage terminase, small subunit n=1 Tax=Mycobacterium bohemicum DSM 44277 TaxID=1236609 RepID=A0A0U0WAB8_MYCBE|nr:phage terminase small subunit P27 family [Mycobacterium bohemicum]MCV6968172.1 phage terminase small subunit P27 family [Mycobacterium bohemicum]CPR11956.1 Phage terminase, small subunit [Mycobacterium bohemicum DSM 44277]
MSRRPSPNREAPRGKTRRAPVAPAGLGADGLAAWKWVWAPSHPWITERHRGLVERYCRLRDVADGLFRQIDTDGIMSTGSQKQLRTNPALAQLKNLSTELRLCETELGLTPAAESKTAPTPAGAFADTPRARAKARRPDDTLVTLLDDHRRRDA